MPRGGNSDHRLISPEKSGHLVDIARPSQGRRGTRPAAGGCHLSEGGTTVSDPGSADVPTQEKLLPTAPLSHRSRILLLYNSLREQSYSRFLTLQAERFLQRFGAETRVFDPRGLPLPDATAADRTKVREPRELSLWLEGQVWTSTERHGAMTAASDF